MYKEPILQSDTDGRQEWRLNGHFHRGDGPAIIYPDGSQSWYRNGNLHREDGPAAIYPDGLQYWYLNNNRIRSMKVYQKKLNLSDEDVTALILKYGDIK